MQLTVSNSVVSNTLETEVVFLVNTSLVTSNTISIGSGPARVNTTAAGIGSNVYANSTALVAPLIMVGSTSLVGSMFSGVIDYQEFTSNGTWYNPYANSLINSALTGDEEALIMMWGPGATGYVGSGGGSGGGCFIGFMPISKIANTANVTLYPSSNSSNYTTGTYYMANTEFSINSSIKIVSVGGAWSFGNGGPSSFYLQGNQYSSNTYLPNFTANGDSTLFYSSPDNYSIYYGGKTAGNTYTIFGGGARSVAGSTTNAGSSIYGGGGGSANSPSSYEGNSVFGGWGGNSTSLAGGIPGGGGGINSTSAGVGGRGEVRVWVIGGAKTVYA